MILTMVGQEQARWLMVLKLMVLSISWASTGYDSFTFSGEIQNFTLLLSFWVILSPPATAMSIVSRFPCSPRALAKSLRIALVPAPLSTRTLPSRILPFADLKPTLTTGIMLFWSRIDVAELADGGSACRRRWKRLHPFFPHFSFDLHSLDTWPLFRHAGTTQALIFGMLYPFVERTTGKRRAFQYPVFFGAYVTL